MSAVPSVSAACTANNICERTVPHSFAVVETEGKMCVQAVPLNYESKIDGGNAIFVSLDSVESFSLQASKESVDFSAMDLRKDSEESIDFLTTDLRKDSEESDDFLVMDLKRNSDEMILAFILEAEGISGQDALSKLIGSGLSLSSEMQAKHTDVSVCAGNAQLPFALPER
eukprot:TRINITY_DN17355_c0_g1_i1.p1 TRINITY_DN17355_c0_g1~~TRINITY_DN17355_c0_g1_i1.p1  ORF type:complete len:171 (-),score=30.63 TRINITY_DN17355_c0_g1_i1:219-731(-)